jgi:putative SOS response-associated peptidase YedK
MRGLDSKLSGLSYVGKETTMCGRFTAEYTWAEVHDLHSLSDKNFPVSPHNMQPRYNIAPTQDVDFLAIDRGGNPELLRGRWWLVPFFANELPKAAMFNARIETVYTSGAFREPFKKRPMPPSVATRPAMSSSPG